MGGPRDTSYAVCQACQRWRFINRIVGKQCLCGETWPKAVLDEVGKQKGNRRQGEEGGHRTGAKQNHARNGWYKFDVAEASQSERQQMVQELVAGLSKDGCFSTEVELPWASPPAAPAAQEEEEENSPQEKERTASNAFRGAMDRARRAQETLAWTAQRLQREQEKLEQTRAQYDKDTAAHTAAQTTLDAAVADVQSARAAAQQAEATRAANAVKPAPEEEAKAANADPDSPEGAPPGKRARTALPPLGGGDGGEASEEEQQAWTDFREQLAKHIKQASTSKYEGDELSDTDECTPLVQELVQKLQSIPKTKKTAQPVVPGAAAASAPMDTSAGEGAVRAGPGATAAPVRENVSPEDAAAQVEKLRKKQQQ